VLTSAGSPTTKFGQRPVNDALALRPNNLRQEAKSETPISTAQPPARQEARLSSPNGYTSRQSGAKGSSPQRAQTFGSVTCKSLSRTQLAKLRACAAKRSGPIAVSWIPLPTRQEKLVAFAISKRVGNAVVRTKLRRRLREAARLDPTLPAGGYLVRAQPKAAFLPYSVLAEHLHRAASLAAQAEGEA
jgi:ribonuclease P protein component